VIEIYFINTFYYKTKWACKVHNIVNEALGKEQFNCNLVGDR